MEWIKKNPHLLTLAIFAALLVAASAMAVLNSQSFAEKFSAVQNPAVPNNRVPEQDFSKLEEAQSSIDKPNAWQVPTEKKGRYLFVPERFMLDENGRPTKPESGSIYRHSLTKEEIPNTWFIERNLPLLDRTVPRQDADKDGFWNEDEWKGNTDPTKVDSHPPYYTRVFLKQYIAVPFRLKFQTWDGDPKKPESLTFQINTLDLRQPTEFLPIGAKVSRTKFQIKSFEQKTFNDPNLGEKDISELTLLDTEFNTEIKLILGQVANSPDSFALFTYLWPQPPLDIRVRKLQEFVLKPNTQERYKLLDIKEGEAVIQLPSGEKYAVPRLPQGYP